MVEEAATREGTAAVLARLRAGEELPEGTLIRCLRSSACPRELVEHLAGCHWTRALQRVPPLLLRHPGCPRPFAWQIIPRLGWNDLLQVARDPRTAPAIRRQCERKVSERIKSLTLGERTALARLATRGLIANLLADGAEACVLALLDNPQFTELDAVRLVNVNRHGGCLLALLRHPRWGASRVVTSAAVRSPTLPVGVALGLIATLSGPRLEELARSPGVSDELRDAARLLAQRRRAGARGGGGGQG
jgi:hypothetical protein